jgi:hypothetical protein
VKLQEATTFVCARGIVLESARGPVPSIAEAIVGEPIKGSWWSHPRAKEIFRVTRALRSSDSVLVCRLVASRITFVHQRLWPALMCVGGQFPPRLVARLHERHTDSGEHVLEEVPFPTWVPAQAAVLARHLDEGAAWATLHSCAPEVFRAR